MITYNSASIYISSKKSLVDKIKAVDAILDALDDAELDAALNENKSLYILDDGQTKIQVNYRGLGGIESARLALEQRKQRYVNQLNGRVVRLVDSKSVTRNPYFNGRY